MSTPTPINSKLPGVGTTIFSVMSKMADEYGAINLSQGFPDFTVSPRLINLVDGYMSKGFNQYAPMPGYMPLIRSISKMVKTKRGVLLNGEEEITVTVGATEAIYATLAAIVQTGDEVILFDPAYDCYDPVIRLNGGKPIHLSLKQPDFSIDWDEVRNHINNNTRLIIVNTPHNPSGAVMSSEDIKALEKIVSEYGVLVLSDEVYEHIIFDGEAHCSILKSPLLRQNGVAVYSFGKTFHATGWKVGYAIAPQWLTTEIRKVHQYLTFSVNTPIQCALADYCEDESTYIGLAEFYEQKRDVFLRAIAPSGFVPVKSKGTYFQLLSYKEVDSSLNDIEMSELLTKKFGVASIPISVFYNSGQDDKLLRFCFAKDAVTLNKAGEILCKI